MVPGSAAEGAMGSGWRCGHGTVCTYNSVSGHLRCVVRMLLQPKSGETE